MLWRLLSQWQVLVPAGCVHGALDTIGTVLHHQHHLHCLQGAPSQPFQCCFKMLDAPMHLLDPSVWFTALLTSLCPFLCSNVHTCTRDIHSKFAVSAHPSCIASVGIYFIWPPTRIVNTFTCVRMISTILAVSTSGVFWRPVLRPHSHSTLCELACPLNSSSCDMYNQLAPSSSGTLCASGTSFFLRGPLSTSTTLVFLSPQLSCSCPLPSQRRVGSI